MEYSTFGRHIALDAWGVDFDLLNHADRLKELLIEAAKSCGATVLSVQSKQFEPQGATVLVLLSESHLSIHTYPEKGFAALDCYTCGEHINPEIAIQHLVDILKPTQIYTRQLIRGKGEMEVVQPKIVTRELTAHSVK